jgi:hypothetical protein
MATDTLRLVIALFSWMTIQPTCFADVLYDNGDFNGRTALLSVRGIPANAEVADDFTFTAASVIDEVQAKFVFDDFPHSFDVLVYEHNPDGPGALLHEMRELNYEVSHFERYRGAATCVTVTIRGLSLALDAGEYFLAIRGVASDNSEATSWGSSAGSPEDVGEAYFRSQY